MKRLFIIPVIALTAANVVAGPILDLLYGATHYGIAPIFGFTKTTSGNAIKECIDDKSRSGASKIGEIGCRTLVLAPSGCMSVGSLYLIAVGTLFSRIFRRTPDDFMLKLFGAPLAVLATPVFGVSLSVTHRALSKSKAKPKTETEINIE